MATAPQVSPDGRWIAYTTNESGEHEVYVRPFPDIEKGRWQVSTNNGENPLWSPDGKELFYQNEGSVMAVAVETEPTFNPGKPELLFQGRYFDTSNFSLHTWDIHPDGDKFLMIKPPQTTTAESTEEEPAPAPQPKITVVLNWFEYLKDRVPTE